MRLSIILIYGGFHASGAMMLTLKLFSPQPYVGNFVPLHQTEVLIFCLYLHTKHHLATHTERSLPSHSNCLVTIIIKLMLTCSVSKFCALSRWMLSRAFIDISVFALSRRSNNLLLSSSIFSSVPAVMLNCALAWASRAAIFINTESSKTNITQKDNSYNS